MTGTGVMAGTVVVTDVVVAGTGVEVAAAGGGVEAG